MQIEKALVCSYVLVMDLLQIRPPTPGETFLF